MTVTAKETIKYISGSGWSNPLTHNAHLEDSSYLEVWADNTQLTLGVDFTVADVGDPDGYEVTITTPSNWTPDVWVLKVNTPMTQPQDLSAGGTFGQSYEEGLDYLGRRVQRAFSEQLRAIKLRHDTERVPTVLAVGDEGTVLKFDANGDLIVGPSVTDIQNAAANAAAAAASATAAATSASSAAASVTAAAAQSSAAASSASAAAASAGTAAAAVAAVGLQLEFSTTTADADPGSGVFRLNNADPSSATQMYIDDEDGSGNDIVAFLGQHASAKIMLRQIGDPTKWAAYFITAMADLTGYNRASLTHIDSGTLFDDGAEILVHMSTIGGVSSVNSKFGAVVIDPDDLDDSSTANKFATTAQIANWDSAFGWGNHALAGYADAAATTAALAGKSDTGHGHTESDISDLDKYTQAQVDARVETLVATQEPDTDVTEVIQTGLGAYRDVRVEFAFHTNTAGADVVVSGRVSGGTWRTILTSDGGSSNKSVFGEFVIRSFGDNSDLKQIHLSAGYNTNDFDRSDQNRGANASVGDGYLSRTTAEAWDEVRVAVSSGTIEGDNADRRGRFRFIGIGVAAP